MIDLSYIRQSPDHCHHEVTRGGELQPCDKPAVAVRLELAAYSGGGLVDGAHPYPVCKHHTAGDVVPLRVLLGAEVAR